MVFVTTDESIEEESWYQSICEDLDAFCKKVDEKIEKEQQHLKECKKRNELQTKLQHERKLNEELTQQLVKLSHRGDAMERACTKFSKLSITKNDQQRLDEAKELIEWAKVLTGIRFDFSAPPNRMKGYIKNEARRSLVPFDMPVDSDALWNLLLTSLGATPHTGTAQDPEGMRGLIRAIMAAHPDKENRRPNNKQNKQ